METLIDPEYHDTDWTPSGFTQAAIGATILITIALALFGAAEILQEVQATFMGLR